MTSFVVSHYLPRMFMLIPLSSKREREAKRTEDEREREKGKGGGGGEAVGLRGKSSQYFTGSQNQKTGKTETIS